MLIKKLDALQENKDYKARRLGAFVVFLSLKDEFRKDETRDARLKEIEQFVSGVMPKHTTIGLAEATETPDGTNAPLVPAQVQAMGVGPEDDIVVEGWFTGTLDFGNSSLTSKGSGQNWFLARL